MDIIKRKYKMKVNPTVDFLRELAEALGGKMEINIK